MRITAIILCMSAFAMGQESFEVVSIKRSDSTAAGSSIGVAPGGIFKGRNATVGMLIGIAYNVREFQVSGGPGWMNTEGYDIEAKGNGPAVTELDLMKMPEAQRNEFQRQMQARLRALLADRFQLRVHQATKEMPIYALTVAKSGLKMTKSTEGPSPQSGLGMRRNAEGKSEMTGMQATLENQLVPVLSSVVGRTVMDRTGLQSTFDFTLTFARDLTDNDGPSIFTALEEQLGLKLDSQKGPVEMIVIDRVEHASAN